MLAGAGLLLFKNHIRRWAASAQAALEGRTVDDVRFLRTLCVSIRVEMGEIIPILRELIRFCLSL